MTPRDWLDAFAQIALVVAAFAGIMVPMHRANRERAERLIATVDRLGLVLHRQGKALRKHDRRTKKLAQRLEALEVERHARATARSAARPRP